MEIKNENSVVINMSTNEFENLKKFIKQSCTVTTEVKQRMARVFAPSHVDQELYDVMKPFMYEDFCWSDVAYPEIHFTNFHKSYPDTARYTYEKIKQMYKTSVQMPDLFTDKEKQEIKFEYGLALCFEKEMNNIANSGQVMVDLVCASDDGPAYNDWVLNLVDQIEGGESK